MENAGSSQASDRGMRRDPSHRSRGPPAPARRSRATTGRAPDSSPGTSERPRESSRARLGSSHPLAGGRRRGRKVRDGSREPRLAASAWNTLLVATDQEPTRSKRSTVRPRSVARPSSLPPTRHFRGCARTGTRFSPLAHPFGIRAWRAGDHGGRSARFPCALDPAPSTATAGIARESRAWRARPSARPANSNSRTPLRGVRRVRSVATLPKGFTSPCKWADSCDGRRRRPRRWRDSPSRGPTDVAYAASRAGVSDLYHGVTSTRLRRAFVANQTGHRSMLVLRSYLRLMLTPPPSSATPPGSRAPEPRSRCRGGRARGRRPLRRKPPGRSGWRSARAGRAG